MEIEEIRNIISSGGQVEYSAHCQKRMLERNISREDVMHCIYTGKIIEEYPLDEGNYSEKSLPSCLILGVKKTTDEKIHVVVGYNNKQVLIISTCYPDSRWNDDFETRREK
jgi:hypothetical protein